MADEYRVKGSSLTTKLDFVGETQGPAAVTELRQFLRSEGAYLILESEWYPYRIFDHLLVAIAERCFGGDLSKLDRVGRFSAQKALRSTYGVYAGGGDVEALLGKLSSLHGRYYSQGRMDVTFAPDRRSCDLVLSGAPEYSEADLRVAAGFFSGAAELFGLEGVGYSLHRSPGGAQVHLYWSSAAK